MKGVHEREFSFKPGDIVIVKHDLFQDSVISIIQETDDNYIYLAFPREFKGAEIKIGDKLECRVPGKSNEFLVSCRINNINKFYPMYLHLYVEKISVYKCRRAAKRYLADYDAYCTIPDTAENIAVVLKNISQTGILVWVSKKNLKSFENVSEVQMKLVTEDNETICFGAKVIRTVSKGRIDEFGMQINNIDRSNRDALAKVLSRIEDEMGSLVLSYIMSGSINEANN
jgi:ribosomal protein L14E/L6E/L27E